MIEKAASFWGKAGQGSLARLALAEAEAQLTRALALIASLPGTPALRRQQIKLQVILLKRADGRIKDNEVQTRLEPLSRKRAH